MTSLSLTGLGMKNSFISISDMDDSIKMGKGNFGMECDRDREMDVTVV